MRTTTHEWLYAGIWTLLTSGIIGIILLIGWSGGHVDRDIVLGVFTIGGMGFLICIALSWTTTAKVAQLLHDATEHRCHRIAQEKELAKGLAEGYDENEAARIKMLYEAARMLENKCLNRVAHITGERPVLNLPKQRYILPSWANGSRGK